MRNPAPYGASTENPLPPPGTMSTVRCLCFQYSHCAGDIESGVSSGKYSTQVTEVDVGLGADHNSRSAKHMGRCCHSICGNWWNKWAVHPGEAADLLRRLTGHVGPVLRSSRPD